MAIQRGTEAWRQQAQSATNYLQSLYVDISKFASWVSWARGFTSWTQVFNVLNAGGSPTFNLMASGGITYQTWQQRSAADYQTARSRNFAGTSGTTTGSGGSNIPGATGGTNPSPLPPPTNFVPPPPGSIYDPVTGTYQPAPPLPNPPPNTLPGATPGQPLADVRTSAKAELTRVLGQFGLAGLADIAWQLYTVSDINDVGELIMALEPTEEFRRLFPGLRDESTGQLLMSPAQWMNYYDQVQSLIGDVGGQPLTRAQVGALIQNRKSVQEIARETEQIRKLEMDSYAKQEFYAYTGHMPTGQDLYALRLGLAPELQSLYEQAVANGISAEEFNARIGSTPLQERRSEQLTDALAPTGAGFTAPTNPEDALAKDRAFALAMAAAESRWKAGGVVDVETKFPERTSEAF